MSQGDRSICPSGQFYDQAVSECRDCETICGPQYGGPTAECQHNCPGYGLTTLSHESTTLTTPVVIESVHGLWWIGIVLAVVVLMAIFIGGCVMYSKKKKKFCFGASQIHHPSDHQDRFITVAEETNQNGKSKLVVNCES